MTSNLEMNIITIFLSAFP